MEFDQNTAEVTFEYLRDRYDKYIFIAQGAEQTVQIAQGSPYELITMVRGILVTLRDRLKKNFPESFVDRLIKGAAMTDEELSAEVNAKKEIPAWLKRLMEIEEQEKSNEADKTISGNNPERTEEDEAFERAIDKLVDALRRNRPGSDLGRNDRDGDRG